MTRTDEELLADLKSGGVSMVPALAGLAAVQSWCQEYQPESGRCLGVTASVLYKHFKMWCAKHGHKATSSQWFLVHLRKKYGLAKGRDQRQGNRNPYMMSRNCAAYFKAWEEMYPLTLADQIRTSKIRNVEIAMKELGITP